MLRGVDALNSGCPVVYLDVRTRAGCNAGTRQDIIDKAKADYLADCAKLKEAGAFGDSLNGCALAWFHDVLFGDGDPMTTGSLQSSNAETGTPQAIHEALRLSRLRERQRRAARRGDGGELQ